MKPWKSVTQPIQKIVPCSDRDDEHGPFSDRFVLARHRVLRRIGNEHDYKQIRNADNASLPSKNTENDEKEQVDKRAAQYDFARCSDGTKTDLKSICKSPSISMALNNKCFP